MQHLENDMDELFQRAAENYPLKKGAGDWEGIAQKLADESKPVVVMAFLQNNAAKKLIAVSLLIFVFAISWLVFQNTQDVNTNDNAKNNVKGNPLVKMEKGYAEKKSNTNNAARLIAPDEKKENKNAVLHLIKSNSSLAERVANNSIIKSNEFFSKEYFKEKEHSIIAENLNIGTNQSALQNQIDNERLQQEKKVNDIPGQTAKKRKELSHSIQNKKGIYLGIIAGPDFSKVYSGSFNHSGVNAGLIAGYRLNKKISFETGITWDKKYYTSKGENFSLDKVASTMPSGMIINTISSNSSFVEIPLKVKFDFYQKRNAGLFVSAGISSYIITKEQNMYQVTLNGNDEKIFGIYKKIIISCQRSQM